MNRRLSALVLTLAACATATPPAVKGPEVVVAELYATLGIGHVSGAPSAGMLDTLRPMLSDSLSALLKAARLRREADIKGAPDEKPSFAEGDLFSSLFEGPTEFTAVTDSTAKSPERVLLKMVHTDAKDTVRWVDTAIVERVNGKAVLADVRFGGTWDFGNKGSLRASLETALRSAP